MTSISRRAARECAVRALYSYDFNTETDPILYFALVCAEAEMAKNDFAASLFMGTVEHLEQIDARIAEHAKGWRLDRIARMSLALMRLCTYEMMFTEVPHPVALNEAIEIAKVYDTDDAPSFINGILNAIEKSLI